VRQVSVVGHVEWVDFLRVERLPAAGEILPAQRLGIHAGGGAVVAAAALAELGAAVDFFTAVGDDAIGETAASELRARGISVHAAVRPGPTRQVITLLDAAGERSIVTIGERLQPTGDDALEWERLRAADGVYFTAGDLAALHAARQARVLVATPRISERLSGDAVDVELDAVVFSAGDPRERTWAEGLSQHSRLLVATNGAHGGSWSAGAAAAGGDTASGASGGRWSPAPLPGPFVDTYGAGDSFAAGFTYGLADTGEPAAAARVGAECSARMLTRAGAP
jgi:ribokinase